MTFRAEGRPNTERPAALPALTVDNKRDAESLQIWLCKLTYPPDERYILNPELRPRGTDEIARVDDFTDRVIPELQRKYAELKQRRR